VQNPATSTPERPPDRTPDRTMVENVRFRALQLHGKIRRFIRASVYTRENEALLAKRRGECTRCGACCKILIRCPFLLEEDGEYSCSIHGRHFAQCQLFPLVPQDLKEIDEECGYEFESK
jgi:hypothetical protein